MVVVVGGAAAISDILLMDFVVLVLLWVSELWIGFLRGEVETVMEDALFSANTESGCHE